MNILRSKCLWERMRDWEWEWEWEQLPCLPRVVSFFVFIIFAANSRPVDFCTHRFTIENAPLKWEKKIGRTMKQIQNKKFISQMFGFFSKLLLNVNKQNHRGRNNQENKNFRWNLTFSFSFFLENSDFLNIFSKFSLIFSIILPTSMLYLSINPQ